VRKEFQTELKDKYVDESVNSTKLSSMINSKLTKAILEESYDFNMD